jgi:D-alanyl-lipoteichoic acid acyltransferase DltB (MBOAT superfamily)
LFGIELITNFKTPYFSRNIAEFWRRWHISLSSWFRDYVYIPLGGSKSSIFKSIRNIFIIFILSGFWHGANWTYIIWGGLHAAYFIPSFLMKKNRKYINFETSNSYYAKLKELIAIVITFGLTTFAFFRSNTVIGAINYIKGIFNPINFFKIQSAETYVVNIRPLLIYISIFLIIDWYYKNENVVFTKVKETKKSILLKYLFYLFTIISILLSIKNQATSFIYFQF